MKKFFIKILRILAKRVIQRYKPLVVGVTGSVGKTTAKEAIFTILSRNMHTRKNEENYNNEVGTPLTVLDIEPLKNRSIFEKLRLIDNMLGALWLAYGFSKFEYPKALVLELGADKPGDIKYLVDIVRPQIGVITAVGDIPVHVEFYASPQEVAKEKAKLINALDKDGTAVLNYDDETVRAMSEKTKGAVMSFGFSSKADIWVSDVVYFVDDTHNKVGGISFKVHQEESFIPARIEGMIAAHQLYGLLSATAVALKLGINMVDISEAFERIDFPRGRMKLLHGIDDSIIIDDTYNSAPLSAHAALESLKAFTSATRRVDRKRRRKIAILGDMRELGVYTESTHRTIGKFASEMSDIVIGVGSASIFIVEEAKKKLGDKRVAHFDNVEDLVRGIRGLVKPKDIILIKGSQSIRLEKAVKAILNEPGRASELLVRQYGEWLKD
ncbi:MAG: Mur ligase family protein [Parcubacteria group bacterium]